MVYVVHYYDSKLSKQRKNTMATATAIETTHPENGYDVTLRFDEDKRLTDAYYDNDEQVELTSSIKSQFQADIDTYFS